MSDPDPAKLFLGRVMTMHKLTAGDGYTYLTRQVAVQDTTERAASSLGDYYAEKGESPGRWWGSGLAAVGIEVGSEVTEAQMRNLFGEGRHPNAELIEEAALDEGRSVNDAMKATQLGRLFAVYEGHASEFLKTVAERFGDDNRAHGQPCQAAVPAGVRARIRTEVANEMFVHEHGREPLDDRERAGFLATVSRQETTAMAGYDLTFSPVKSVSTLWAVADPEVAKQVEVAHHAAVERTLKHLEDEVLYSRRGRGGVQKVKAVGLLATMFTHRDARSCDPHLHTHVAVSNKVQDETGRWLAVDGTVLFKAKVSLSETYNTLLEAELVDRLGVEFAERKPHAGADRKRAVREIVGIDPRLAESWSSRDRAINGRRRELTVAFQKEHGRPPTESEAVVLKQQAWEQTRQHKHEPRAERDQRYVWRDEAVAILGSNEAVESMVSAALGRHAAHREIHAKWVAKTAAAVVARVSADRATWQVWHLRAEAQRAARAAGVRLEDLDQAIEQVVTSAIEDHSIPFAITDPLTDPTLAKSFGVTIPEQLVREDGECIYTVHGSRQYTSAAVLNAERSILDAASRTGGRVVDEVEVGVALAESAANGIELNAAQAAMVRELATSGRRLQLALAPAGTGKTTAMSVLSQAWRGSGGTVIGLAPSAVAAEELGSAIRGDDVVSDTLAKLVWHIEHGDLPTWMGSIDGDTLVLIDEAGMAATTELATVTDWLAGRGATIRLIGDDRQLASVAAGGVLRDVADQVGAVTLTEVRRFVAPDGSLNAAEAGATLAVRDGDPAAIGYYADMGRIHVGDLGSAADQAYAAWSTDRAAGLDSRLLAPTRELVAELNTRARNDRIAGLPEPEIGRTLTLADGTCASARDTIVTRRNERLLALSPTDWVKNGDRWQVAEVHPDGSMTAVHDELGARIRLPADYTARHVQLGYATTVHGAQGATVDTCHLVLTGEEDRDLLYVGLSRGRRANHLYLSIASDGDPHNVIRPEALIPPTALDRLAGMLHRDGSPVSATTAMRAENSPPQLLREAAERYHDSVTTAAEAVVGDAGMARIDACADALDDSLTEADAWPTLRGHLALLACDEHDPVRLLTDAVRLAGLDDARDLAAVVDARIERILSDSGHDRTPEGPLTWLPSAPAGLIGSPEWSAYLARRAEQVTSRVASVMDEARAWSGGTAPAWAHPFLEESDAELRARLSVWRAATGVADEDLRPTGPRAAGSHGDHQRALNRALREARPSYPFAQRTWYQTLPDSVRADAWITPLCQRLARLEHAGLPVGEYVTQALTDDRPLPDEYQAAALWWRLVPHLGPAAIEADRHSGDLLVPAWMGTLAELVGAARADYLRSAPAWPSLVAAVDEACGHHGWEARLLLASALEQVPQDGSLTGVEVADALTWQVASLTTEETFEYEPHQKPPEDLDVFLADLYRDQHDELPEDNPYFPLLSAEADEVSAEFAFPEPGEISAERMLELNTEALAFFESCYSTSWAPTYLAERLGTDLTNHATLTAGYAPPGPCSLLTHLTASGATVDELEQAGLVRLREHRDGRTDHVDAFRDRLVLPIRDPSNAASVIGFLGRRNPLKGDDDYAGPKYLNTKTTAVFTKGEALYGYAESTDALANGALPVIVEGPMDALAITLASSGRAVGLAPMGTALTTDQIRLLLRHIHLGEDNQHIAVAYDADRAGWKAARTAYWNLTAADLDPLHIALPNGLDPSELLRIHGPAAVVQAIASARPLGDAMLDDLLDREPAQDMTIPTPPAESWPPVAPTPGSLRSIGSASATISPTASSRAPRSKPASTATATSWPGHRHDSTS